MFKSSTQTVGIIRIYVCRCDKDIGTLPRKEKPANCTPLKVERRIERNALDALSQSKVTSRQAQCTCRPRSRKT